MATILSVEKDGEAAPEKAPGPVAARPEGAKTTILKVERDLDAIIAKAAERYKLDPLLIRAIIQRESGGNPQAVGPDTHAQPGQRASGLMQLMPGTAKDMGVTDVFDPEQNIMGGTRYFRQLLDHPAASGDVGKALLHYVGGRDPKQWGAQSFAYPHLVLEEYRKLGGRLMDPQVPKASAWERAVSATVPFDGVARLLHGKGPDLSRFSTGPDTGQPVGAKLKAWWNSISPRRELFHKSMANYADENPLMATAADVVGGLPAALALGKGVQSVLTGGLGGAAVAGARSPLMDTAANVLSGPATAPWLKGLTQTATSPGATQAIAPWRSFLAGTAGRGLPSTGEGASLGTRIASGAAQGAIQGATGGAAFSHLSPDTSTLEDAAGGALMGGALGAAVPTVAAGWNRALFGKRIDPQTAQLGLDAKAGLGMPKVPLRVDPNQVNNFSLDPRQYSRVAGEMVDAPTPFVMNRGQLVGARRAIGDMFDTATPRLTGAVDRTFIQEFSQLGQLYRNDPNVKRALEALPQYKTFTKKLSGALHLDGGMLSGEDIHAWTRQGKVPGLVTQLSKSSDPSVREFGKGLRKILDDSLERGTEAKVQNLLAQNRQQEAGEAIAMLKMFRAAKEKYRLLEPLEAAIDPVTQKVVPRALHKGAEAKGGEFEKFSRAGLAFDPDFQAAPGGMRIPYSGLAAALALGTQDHVTTGQAVLAALAGNVMNKTVRAVARKSPGYGNALLRRSANLYSPGPMESLLGTVVPSAGVLAGINSGSREEQGR